MDTHVKFWLVTREDMANHGCRFMLSHCSTSSDHTRLLHSQNTAVTPRTAFLTVSLTSLFLLGLRVESLCKQKRQSLGWLKSNKFHSLTRHSSTSSLCTWQRDHEPHACHVFSSDFMCTYTRLLLTTTVYIFVTLAQETFNFQWVQWFALTLQK